MPWQVWSNKHQRWLPTITDYVSSLCKKHKVLMKWDGREIKTRDSFGPVKFRWIKPKIGR